MESRYEVAERNMENILDDLAARHGDRWKRITSNGVLRGAPDFVFLSEDGDQRLASLGTDGVHTLASFGCGFTKSLGFTPQDALSADLVRDCADRYHAAMIGIFG